MNYLYPVATRLLHYKSRSQRFNYTDQTSSSFEQPPLMRHLRFAEHFAAVAVAAVVAPPLPPPPAASSGIQSDTFLVLAAVFCFLLCVVGLALVARCSRLCNPSAYSVDASSAAAAAMPAASKGLKRKALQSLPTMSFEAGGEGEERPECAICLTEFAAGDEVRVLPPCGHGFHAACVDAWLLTRSTCPSCRRALVVAQPAAEHPPVAYRCAGCGGAVSATAHDPTAAVAAPGERGGCRTSMP